MRKRGQYFIIDAFMALVVLSIGLVLFFAVGSYQPNPEHAQLLSYEIGNKLAQTRVRDLNYDFVREHVAGGNITNGDSTLMQQAFEFKHYHDSISEGGNRIYDPVRANSNLSARFLEIVTGTEPSQFNFEIIIDGEVIYGQGSGDSSEAEVLISNRQMVFGALNKSGEFWGPVIAEVRVWQ